MQARDIVIGVFDERDDAEDAINALRDAGFRADEIGVVARDRDAAGVLADDTGTQTGTGAATGAVAGGVLGGAIGWLAGLGTLAVPGVGPVLAAGPLAAAVTGAAVGAVGGGLVGALAEAGVPEEEARWYDERVRQGGYLVSVNTHGRYDEARSIMADYGGYDFQATSVGTTRRPWTEAAPEVRSRYEAEQRAGRRWEEVEPAHRFGYEAYGDLRNRGYRDWRSAEPELQQRWGERGTGTWDEHRIYVRRGYDYGRGRRRFREEG